MCNPIWTAWECISATYLIQIILIVIGLVFGVVGLISRDITSVLIDQKPLLKIKEFEFNPQMPRKTRIGLQIFSGILVVLGVGWIFVTEIQDPVINKPLPSSTQATVPTGGISLISMKYTSGGMYPHMVDLRNAESSGIPAGPTFSLKFSEIMIFAPPELAGFQARAEFYANGIEKIGETPFTIIQSGLTALDQVKIEEDYRYFDNNTGKYSDDSWYVQNSWNAIEIKLNYMGQSGLQGSTTWPVKLNQMGGTAWWDSPPYVNVVSVVYSVSDGFRQVLDMRGNPTPVIHAKEGDWITIHEIWYKANSNSDDRNIRIAASINDGQQELEGKESERAIIREGIHQLESFKGMTWIISPGIKWLGLILIRDDETILDRYTVEISDTKLSGLISMHNGIVWQFDQFEYIDFEKLDDFKDWSGVDENTVIQSNEISFSGESSLAVTVMSDQTQSFVERNRSTKATNLVGQVYWPQQDGIDVQWAQICITPSYDCISIPTGKDFWNTFVVDLSELEYIGEKLDQIQLSSFFIQGEIIGTGSDQPYTFYVDGIQIFPARDQ